MLITSMLYQALSGDQRTKNGLNSTQAERHRHFRLRIIPPHDSLECKGN